METLGMLRAVEGIDVLTEHIAFPMHPETWDVTARRTSGYATKVAPGYEHRLAERFPAVRALIEIGEPCIPQVIAKLGETDLAVVGHLTVALDISLEQEVEAATRMDIALEVPRSPLTAVMVNEVWDEIYDRVCALSEEHATTLIFVNTRKLAERLAFSLGERLGKEHVTSHHGSMSREHRHSAEQRLKAGQLKVLVATASMELGIDIGSVELVIQIGSPRSISGFLQRMGRSRHQVGGVPKGIIFRSPGMS
jgi:ATP-dependent helicase YprA (DUF1998 family)